MTLGELKDLNVKGAQELYEHPANQLIAGMQIQHIDELTRSIEKIEKAVLASARELPYYSKLATLPGVGRILGMTITLEVGEVTRFAGLETLPATVERWRLNGFPTAGKRARTTPSAATNICRGRLWKRPILRDVSMDNAGSGLIARQPRPAM